MLDSSSVLVLLSWSFWPGFARSCQVLLDLFPLLNPPRPGPTFRQAAPDPTGLTLSLRLFFASCFRPRFLSIFSPFWPPFWLPKSTQNRKKTGKMGLQTQLCFFIVFLSLFGWILARSWTGRTLDFAHPYSTLATFLHFHLSAVGSPLGSVLASKNHPKIDEKSTPSVKKRLPKRTSKMTSNFDGIFLDFGLQNGVPKN